MTKERYSKFIQEFNKITTKRICDEIGVNAKNVYGGNTTTDNLILISERLQYELKKLLLEYENYYINDIYNDRKIEVLDGIDK